VKPNDWLEKRPSLKLNARYYVLSLSERSTRLYEAFRDTLIDIQNKGLPIDFSTVMAGPVEPALCSSKKTIV